MSPKPGAASRLLPCLGGFATATYTKLGTLKWLIKHTSNDDSVDGLRQGARLGSQGQELHPRSRAMSTRPDRNILEVSGVSV